MKRNKKEKPNDNSIIVRTERHIVKNNKMLDELAFKSKNLYNLANYYVRQCFILCNKDKSEWQEKDHELMNYINSVVDKYNNNPRKRNLNKEPMHYPSKENSWLRADFIDFLIKNLEQENNPYRQLPAMTSQQIINILDNNWKSFFKSIKEWKKNPRKFTGRPKLPKYKHKEKGRNIVCYTSQQKADIKKILETCSLKSVFEGTIKQLRIIPKYGYYVVEIVKEKENKKENIEKYVNNTSPRRVVAIDFGVNNLLTVTNNFGDRPFIINGKHIKSINKYYNKLKAKAMSYVGNRGTSKRLQRIEMKYNNIINEKFHKISRWFINYCIDKDVDHIIMGERKGWKQEADLGKINNQTFVSIPFNKIKNMIEYKANEYGIKIIKTDESYTSKCDALNKEKIGYKQKYDGKREHRGLFISKTGVAINADVNGSLNIMRKVIGDNVIDEIIKNKYSITPYRITL